MGSRIYGLSQASPRTDQSHNKKESCAINENVSAGHWSACQAINRIVSTFLKSIHRNLHWYFPFEFEFGGRGNSKVL